MSENTGRDDATTKENRAERKSALEKRKRGGSARDASDKGGDTAVGDGGREEPRGKRVNSVVAPAIASKGNTAVDEGPHKTSGSGGSGSGGGSGGGSGSSAQTGRRAAQQGFESSSQRENSPNSEKGPNSDKGSDKGDAGVEA